MIKMITLIACLLGCFFGLAQTDTRTKQEQALFYVAKYKEDKICAISYTFDDGLQEHYTLVAPQLEKNGFRGTFWVWGKCIENDSAAGGKPRMTWAQLKEMSKKGHEISSHSWSHATLTRIKPDSLKMEIEKNDTVLFEKLGIWPRTFGYPANAMNKLVVEMASKNRVGTRTKQYAVGNKATAESLRHWLDSLLENRGWGVTMTHGITYGHDAFRNPGVLWEHFDKVKTLSDKVWVGTFQEVAAYVKEQENVQLDIIEKKHSYIITPQLSLDKELFTEPLTMVVNVEEKRKIKVTQDKKKLPVTVLPHKALFSFNPYGGTIQVDFN